METFTIQDIHKEELKILDEFLRICKKHSIEYYIIGGTFLGAIRHKGFIPWDDDIDIAMKRPDFEKFLSIANSELPHHMKLLTFNNTEDYRYYLPHLANLNIEIVEKRNEKKGKTINLFIDIFPIDGTPNNALLRKIHYFRILALRLLYSWYYIDEIDTQRKRTTLEKILIVLGKILPTKRIVDPKKVLNRIDSILKSNPVEESDYIGTIMGAYRVREIVPCDFFGKPTEYQFESYRLTGPEKYDEYLTHMYGDYMEPPVDIHASQHLVLDQIEDEKS